MTINDYNNKQIFIPENVAEICRAILSSESEIDQDKEHFWIFGLNTQNHIKYIELVTLGILDSCPVHPREIFRFAILQGVKSIIPAHNHPGDNPKPSQEDIALTRQLKEAGELLLIPILDHVIICKENKEFFSFQQKGLL